MMRKEILTIEELTSLGYHWSGNQRNKESCPGSCVMQNTGRCSEMVCHGLIWTGNRGPKKAMDFLDAKKLIADSHA